MTGDKVEKCPICKKKSYIRLISAGSGVTFSTGLKDKAGQSIWFPKDQKSYYDQAAKRVFNSPMEKKEWMDRTNTIENPYEEKYFNDLKKEMLDTEADQRKEQKNESL